MRLQDIKIGSRFAAIDSVGVVHECGTYRGNLVWLDVRNEVRLSSDYQAFVDKIGWDIKVLEEP